VISNYFQSVALTADEKTKLEDETIKELVTIGKEEAMTHQTAIEHLSGFMDGQYFPSLRSHRDILREYAGTLPNKRDGREGKSMEEKEVPHFKEVGFELIAYI